jgi:regulator of protease activity HflC (stomatin/prohibitin superfamily)
MSLMTNPAVRVAVAVALVLGLVFALVATWIGGVSTGPGEVAVIRNGGPWDNREIRKVVPPASGFTWGGWWSSAHRYPAQQRVYTITSDPKRAGHSGTDVVTVPTSDGVEIGVEGTLYFRLTTDEATLRAFDDRYGNRTYLGSDGKTHLPYDGDEGWTAFFVQVVRPVIYTTLRAQLGSVRCAELIPTCAFVQQGADGSQVGLTAGNSTAVLAKVESEINARLTGAVRATLGGDYFTGFTFGLVRLTLPDKVRASVEAAQAAFADVATSQAARASAQADAEANRARQAGYAACPTCAEIDKVKALPQGLTVYAPGGGTGVSVPVK